MLDILASIVDTLFPPAKSVRRLRGLTPETFRRLLQPNKVGAVVTLSPYQHQIIKAAITANKFHDSKLAATLLGALFDAWYQTQNPEIPTLFIPIPLSQKRLRDRGYNQVTRILENAACAHSNCAPLLTRELHSAPQTSLHRAERLTNIQGIFSYQEYEPIAKYKRILILDDVITTGATLEEALKVLRQALGKSHQIIGVAIAH